MTEFAGLPVAITFAIFIVPAARVRIDNLLNLSDLVLSASHRTFDALEAV